MTLLLPYSAQNTPEKTKSRYPCWFGILSPKIHLSQSITAQDYINMLLPITPSYDGK